MHGNTDTVILSEIQILFAKAENDIISKIALIEIVISIGLCDFKFRFAFVYSFRIIIAMRDVR